MYNASIAEFLKGEGFKIRADGHVSRNGYEYGTLSGSKLILGEKKVDLEDMTQFEYQENIHRISVWAGGKNKGFISGVNSETGSICAGTVEEAMPRDVLSFDAVFERLFPDCKSQMYYDVLSEREMIDCAMIGHPEAGVTDITDRIISKYHLCAQARLRELGFIGTRFPSNEVMDEVLSIRLGMNCRNPFQEWVESLEWDGTPRLRRAFIDYLDVTATALRPESFGKERSPDETEYLESVTEAWFLGAIARIYGPCQHDVVPVLIGPQGAGKGTILRFLAGQDRWYNSSTVDLNHPDRFLDVARGKIIVELGEATQLRKDDAQDKLKAFISKSEDQYRKPYARKEQVFPRHFILAATSNYDDVFTDPTGSRRFYPMTCEASLGHKAQAFYDRWPSAQFEVEQIWAEALFMYKAGHKPAVPQNVRDNAQIVQKDATEVDPRVQDLDEWLDSTPLYAIRDARINRKTIFTEYFEVFEKRDIRPEMNAIWAAWTKQTDKWRKASKCVDVHGTKTNSAYIRIANAGEIPPKLPEISKEYQPPESDEQDPVREFLNETLSASDAESVRHALDKVSVSELYSEFRIFQIDSGRSVMLSRKGFKNKILTEYGLECRKFNTHSFGKESSEMKFAIPREEGLDDEHVGLRSNQ